ncbi:uncharacterized protein LOC110465791 [Mizuhopecten yessoensis]|uniref:Uncharacterized protein n=1 Tax=Mizuhopecten yessoensis TaxID=6573 RepID=A0A210PQZ9_MIZYE|nr:uncharacterized protein LOC110465791 [Mizuhopecten yessoensis]OWF38882.1 hypothetical protein KP79_PYT23649 [Mizuhopecten yessoensis]
MGTKTCLLVYTVGVICEAFGYFTLYWEVTEYDDYHSGLWEACRGEVCSSTTNNLCYFEATQALETLALVIGGVGLLFLFLYFFISQTSYDISLCIASLAAVVFAACCAILGVIIYGCKTSLPVSWSYALAVVGGILYGLAAILIAVYLIRNAEKYTDDKLRMSSTP